VNLAAGETVTITTLFSHSQGDLDIILWDTKCLAGIANSNSSTDNEQIVYTAPDGGIYFLEVYGQSGAENSYDIVLEVSSPRRPRIYLPVVMKK
jgi:hypothetical protein